MSSPLSSSPIGYSPARHLPTPRRDERPFRPQRFGHGLDGTISPSRVRDQFDRLFSQYGL